MFAPFHLAPFGSDGGTCDKWVRSHRRRVAQICRGERLGCWLLLCTYVHYAISKMRNPLVSHPRRRGCEALDFVGGCRRREVHIHQVHTFVRSRERRTKVGQPITMLSRIYSLEHGHRCFSRIHVQENLTCKVGVLRSLQNM